MQLPFKLLSQFLFVAGGTFIYLGKGSVVSSIQSLYSSPSSSELLSNLSEFGEYIDKDSISSLPETIFDQSTPLLPIDPKTIEALDSLSIPVINPPQKQNNISEELKDEPAPTPITTKTSNSPDSKRCESKEVVLTTGKTNYSGPYRGGVKGRGDTRHLSPRSPGYAEHLETFYTKVIRTEDCKVEVKFYGLHADETKRGFGTNKKPGGGGNQKTYLTLESLKSDLIKLLDK